MAETADLRRIPVFADLPEEQLAWFLEQCAESNLSPGDIYARQGDPAESMFVLLEGQYQWRGEVAGEVILFTIEAGEVTGVLPFSRMQQYGLSGSALTAGRLLRFPVAQFPELIQKMPELAKRLVGVMSDRIREATRVEQQRDRLAALGKLSAGLAHELNNPASAARRAASQLRGTMMRIKEASHQLGARELSPAQKSEIDKLETSFTQRTEPPPNPLAARDLEDEIDALLRSHGQNDLWQLAGELAQRGISADALRSLFETLDLATARAALVRIAASLEIFSLLTEIENSTARISDLVGAIKEYTYMDQAPLQNVDIVKGLETTLTILNHKLKRGVTVLRDYSTIPLMVDSFGSELNQVWTNLIDNAIDAMKGQGELRVRTYREGDCVVVEIGDNGPGISAELEAHIFEPFFTTKPVGEGTGLGLDTAQRIVKKHRGNIQLESKPGNTVFQIRLPLSDASGQAAASPNR